MALKPCKECGQEVSTSAETCPNCGVKNPATKKKEDVGWGKGCALGCLGMIVLVGIMSVLGDSGTGTGGSSEPPSSGLDLSAEVRFTGTQFVITNNDDFDWRNTEFDLNGGLVSSGYTYQAGTLEAGATYTIGALQLANGDGERFNPVTMKPQKFCISAQNPAGRTGIYCGNWD